LTDTESNYEEGLTNLIELTNLSVTGRKYGGIDITSLVNYLMNHSNTMSATQHKTLLLAFYNFSKTMKAPLLVRGIKLMISNQSATYEPGSTDFTVYNRPMLDKNNQVSSNDIIIRKRNVYEHNVLISKDIGFTSIESKTDKYKTLMMPDGFFIIKVVDYRNLLMMRAVASDGTDMAIGIFGEVDTPKLATIKMSADDYRMLMTKNDKNRYTEMFGKYMFTPSFTILREPQNQLENETLASRGDFIESTLEANGELTIEGHDIDWNDELEEELDNMSQSKVKDPDKDVPWKEDSESESEEDEILEQSSSYSLSSSVVSINATKHSKYNVISGSSSTIATLKLVSGLKLEYRTTASRTAMSSLLDDVERLDDFERFWCLNLLKGVVSKLSLR
jgi:hypothetical protein